MPAPNDSPVTPAPWAGPPPAGGGRRYVLQAIVPFGAALAVLLAVTLAADPYMLRTDDPAARRPIPISLRLAKPLQVLSRDPEIVFLGTSRTLLGIDPAHVGPKAYNFGVSGLTGPELEALGKLCLERTRVRAMIINVDDFMFESHAGFEGGLGPDVATGRHLIETAASSLLSYESLKDSLRSLTGDGKRGTWRPDGLMISPPRDARFIDKELAATAARRPAHMTDEKFACLDRLLAACRGRGVETVVYIPPIHQRLHDTLVRRDGPAEYTRFRESVAAIAAKNGVRCWDFGPPHSVSRTPLVEPTDLYIDSAHYTVRVGDLLLNRMGFPVKPLDEDRTYLTDLLHPSPGVGIAAESTERH